MSWRREVAKFGALFRRSKPVDDLAEEIRSHLAMEQRENRESGMTIEEAHDAALRRFGNATLAQEKSREMWGWDFVEILWQDLRYGVRQLRRSPGFTAVGIITLTLGIGANTAIFGLLDALLLRPLPVSNPGDLVELWTVIPNRERNLFSYPMASEIARNTKLFSGVAPWSAPIVPMEVNGDSAPGSISALTPDYFRTLGVRPLIGRLFTLEDFGAGAPTADTAVISYAFWQARYGSSPAVLGKTLRTNGHLRTIIGVTPKSSYSPMVGVSIDVWIPRIPPRTSEAELRSRADQGYWLTARLQSGVTVAKARSEMEALWPTILQATVPAHLNGVQREQFFRQRIKLEPAASGFPSTSLLQFERPLWVLVAGVGLLLLIACVNMASLLLARASNRLREMGVRVALGATRWRLTRQVMIEGVLLSSGGAILALPLAISVSGLLVRFVWTGFLPVAFDVRPDWRILIYTGLVACVCGILVSIVPAWQAGGLDPANLVRYRPGTSTAASGIRKAGKALIVAQMGLSLVLMQGACLFARNLAGLHSLNLGFEPNKVLGLLLQPSPRRSKNFDGGIYYPHLLDELARLPGVRCVSLSDEPIRRVSVKWTAPVARGSGQNANADRVDAGEHLASPNFFQTMGISMLQGRDFSFQDDRHLPAVVVVSRSLARRFFPSGDAVGRSITVTSNEGDKSTRIVGVVDDANLFFARNQRPMAFYFAFFQKQNPDGPYVEIKTYGDPRTVREASRRQVETDGQDYVLLSETLKQAVNNTLVNERALALLSSVFGGLALLMVAIGLYGLVSYWVAGRTSEIGVRTALGAQPGGILRLILSDSLLLVAIGVAMGVPLAFVISKLVSRMLFGLSPADPVSLIAAVTAVAGAGLLAAYLPARRATKVDPMVALRYE